jgi:exopolysaccharide production protein ExoQ
MISTARPLTSTVRPSFDAADLARTGAAVAIVVCLSSAPFVALSRWVARVPLATDTWPYRLSYWGGAALGAVLLLVDIVWPALSGRLGRAAVPWIGIAPAAGLVAWTLLSVLWTDSPQRTREHAVLMALVMGGAIWFGLALTFRQQVLALFVGFQSLTLVSVGAALALSSARFAEDDTWMGVFGNPNTLSPVAGLAIVSTLGLLAFWRSESATIVVAVLVVVDLLAVWKADSATGWIALFSAAVAAGAIVLVRRLLVGGAPARRLRSVAMAVVALAVVSIPWSIRVVAGVVGKDRTLTGRTDIWDYVLDRSDNHWFAGYGFMSFWDTEANRLELGERRPFTTIPDTAHSTFFETLLFLGVVGLALLLAVVAVSLGRTWWSALTVPGWGTGWWVAVATFVLLENVTESMITYHSVFWVLLVAPAFAAVEQRRSALENDTPPSLARV